MKKLWLPLSYTLFIIFISVAPINSGDSSTGLSSRTVVFIRWDYLLHFAIFIPWVIIIRIVQKVRFKTNWKLAMGWLLVGLILAVATEFTQNFISYRTYNVNDVIANSLGILIGGIAFLF